MTQTNCKQKTTEKLGRSTKYSEEVKTACLCALLSTNSLSAVARQYCVPESTLRAWKAKAEALDADGEKSLWTRAREEQVKRITVKAAEGARLSAELLCRRLEVGARNLARCEQIDRMLLGGEESEGLVLVDGTAVDEARERVRLTPELEKRLNDERAKRSGAIPSDAALSTMLRALASISEKGAGELGAAVDPGGANAKELLECVEGDEW